MPLCCSRAAVLQPCRCAAASGVCRLTFLHFGIRMELIGSDQQRTPVLLGDYVARSAEIGCLTWCCLTLVCCFRGKNRQHLHVTELVKAADSEPVAGTCLEASDAFGGFLDSVSAWSATAL